MNKENFLGKPCSGVLITGGGSGIGKSTALALAQVGRPVGIWDLNGENAQHVANECNDLYGVKTAFLQIDVRNSYLFDDALNTCKNQIGPIGGFVHAAGIPGPGPIDMVNDELWDSVLDVNLRAAAILTKNLIPTLKEANPGSAIVFLSSIEGHVGSGFLPAYCASKAGLLGLTRSLAQRLGTDSIRVNSICPGVVDTPMMAPVLAFGELKEKLEKQAPLGRVCSPDEIATSIRFLLSNEASFITGTSLIVDGGFIAVSAL